MKYVYESPDGGHTVYRRQIGETQRTLHSVDEHAQTLAHRLEETELWKRILQESKHNPALRSVLDQAKTIYELSRCD